MRPEYDPILLFQGTVKDEHDLISLSQESEVFIIEEMTGSSLPESSPLDLPRAPTPYDDHVWVVPSSSSPNEAEDMAAEEENVAKDIVKEKDQSDVASPSSPKEEGNRRREHADGRQRREGH